MYTRKQDDFDWRRDGHLVVISALNERAADWLDKNLPASYALDRGVVEATAFEKVYHDIWTAGFSI